MTGRYAVTSPPALMREFFGYVEEPDFPPRYNIAPTQPVPILRSELDRDRPPGRHFALMRWGFIPFFVKDPKEISLIINARAETASQKLSFRAALARRRCVFIADAFYEWQTDAAEARLHGAQARRRALRHGRDLGMLERAPSATRSTRPAS